MSETPKKKQQLEKPPPNNKNQQQQQVLPPSTTTSSANFAFFTSMSSEQIPQTTVGNTEMIIEAMHQDSFDAPASSSFDSSFFHQSFAENINNNNNNNNNNEGVVAIQEASPTSTSISNAISSPSIRNSNTPDSISVMEEERGELALFAKRVKRKKIGRNRVETGDGGDQTDSEEEAEEAEEDDDEEYEAEEQEEQEEKKVKESILASTTVFKPGTKKRKSKKQISRVTAPVCFQKKHKNENGKTLSLPKRKKNPKRWTES